MRLLRLRYNITLREIAEAAELSLQHISRIELGLYPANDNTKVHMATAFDRIISNRTTVVTDLIADYAVYGDRLLEFVGAADLEDL